MERNERINEPTIYGLESTDVEMNEVIAEALEHIKEFDIAVERKNSDFNSFAKI